MANKVDVTLETSTVVDIAIRELERAGIHITPDSNRNPYVRACWCLGQLRDPGKQHAFSKLGGHDAAKFVMSKIKDNLDALRVAYQK
jgi:hypothetical protein